jgi:hypothetical protein
MTPREKTHHGVKTRQPVPASCDDNGAMKKPKHWSQSRERVHVPADDRVRTWSGKTTDSKVRSEGRYLAALEAKAGTNRTNHAN